jgi:methanol--5-hydroxybenzimidazolylcobamide Co-methyltransferase
VGDGKVVPEVKYMLKPGFEKGLDLLTSEYSKVTLSVLERSANLGLQAVQLETEFVEPVVLNRGWGRSIAETQKEILSRYHAEHGIQTALRGTIADVRRFDEGLRAGSHFEMMMTSFRDAADGGADALSIESRGGQEVFSYSLIRNDLPGLFFALGILAPRDVRFLWHEIVRNDGGALPAGDTACALANSAMVLAGGLSGRKASHVLSAVIRAMSAVRTLACYEEGARGPGKDCAYENVMVKAVTGYPMSMEGKTSAMAHSSLVGNVAAATCDLWSNETVVFDDAFGGKTSAVMLEMLSYDTALMNQAISTGVQGTLQEMLADSDRFRDPQALVLCPDNAMRIAGAICSAKRDYDRVSAAAREAVMIIQQNKEELRLPDVELKYLGMVRRFLDALPDENKLVDESVRKYNQKVSGFRAANYEL